MHLLDSSAIAIILKRHRAKAVDTLKGKITLGLAGYELGNIIWKECSLKGTITSKEAETRAGEIAKILEIMNIEDIKSNEDFTKTMQLSTELKTTFYDASYLHTAKKNELTLITEDTELREKANKIDIRTK